MRQRGEWCGAIGLAAACALLALPARGRAAAGGLDPTFAGDGTVVTTIGPTNTYSEGLGLALQGDGKIVVGGYSWNGNNYDFAVARHHPDGSLDTSFDGDGRVVTPFGTGDDRGYGLAIQADGKIVISGYAPGVPSYTDFAVVRYNPDGSLDPSFDGDGRALTTVSPSADTARGVAIQADGKIVVAGYTLNTAGSSYDVALVRYNPDGSLDAGFDADGKVITQVSSGGDFGIGVAIQPDGRIVVSGYSYANGDERVMVLRYNPDGSLDASFDGDGVALTPVGASGSAAFGIALQTDGKIVVTGYARNPGNYDVAVVRYNPDGSLDSGFDGDGKAITPIGTFTDYGTAIALQADGAIVVAGSTFNFDTYTVDVAVLRYRADGSLDASFDGDGRVVTPVGADEDVGTGVAIQPDGRIVVSGYTATGSPRYGMLLLRYLDRGACGDSVVDADEQCDDGNRDPGDCCGATCNYEPANGPCADDGAPCTADVCDAVGACTHPAGNGGGLCRPAAGDCDRAEQCDGVLPTCPADQVLDIGVACRAAAGPCDAAEHCDGVAVLCPADARLVAGTPCRAAAGVCDLSEACDGLRPDCPPDGKALGACRAAADVCDLAEQCDGVADDCPVDALAPSGTTCRAAADACDAAETCSGSDAACPSNARRPNGTSCDDGDLCTLTDTCQDGACHGAEPLDCDDGDVCTVDACAPTGGCAHSGAPATGCVTAGQGSLTLTDASPERRDKLRWTWSRGAALAQTALADPTAGTRYGLCIYAGPTQSRVAAAALPPGPGWRVIGSRGYRYKGTGPDGLTSAVLAGGAAGGSKALLKGKGAALPDLPLPLLYPVTVQLRKEGSAVCLESTFTSDDALLNTTERFKAKR